MTRTGLERFFQKKWEDNNGQNRSSQQYRLRTTSVNEQRGPGQSLSVARHQLGSQGGHRNEALKQLMQLSAPKIVLPGGVGGAKQLGGNGDPLLKPVKVKKGYRKNQSQGKRIHGPAEQGASYEKFLNELKEDLGPNPTGKEADDIDFEALLSVSFGEELYKPHHNGGESKGVGQFQRSGVPRKFLEDVEPNEMEAHERALKDRADELKRYIEEAQAELTEVSMQLRNIKRKQSGGSDPYSGNL